MKGLNDIAVIKSKVQVSDGRGGVTTTLTTKIPSLICCIQRVRREVTEYALPGDMYVDHSQLTCDPITSGPVPTEGDVVEASGKSYLVVIVHDLNGRGKHLEVIMKDTSGDPQIGTG